MEQVFTFKFNLIFLLFIIYLKNYRFNKIFKKFFMDNFNLLGHNNFCHIDIYKPLNFLWINEIGSTIFAV